ncbi:MAG: 3-oxoacid CoA-transferase subunit A [Deltaproteobacteria bacterium]|jgi:acetate CoA/acetoacetate CoA-transferase alpha subunit|nr:3-oxoacid CoA-transferase subunit A [Deltaproteobacteria bacterium]
MARIITPKDAAEMIPDGARVMFGGFMTCGGSRTVVDAIVAAGRGNLTLICNDTGLPGVGVARLVENNLVRHLIATHIGLTPETGRQINAGQITCELIPQGTFVERIRSAGAGLGGFLTPTGYGTIVSEDKEVKTVAGKHYLLELPLRAEFAVVKGHKADAMGNIYYRRATRNFNVAMATAADVVIAEVDQIVEVGDIDPDLVMTPGVFVDYLVRA